VLAQAVMALEVPRSWGQSGASARPSGAPSAWLPRAAVGTRVDTLGLKMPRERQRTSWERHHLETTAPSARVHTLCYDGAATVEVADKTACDRMRLPVGDLDGRRTKERWLGGVSLVAVATALTGVLAARGWDTARYDVGEYAHYAQAFWVAAPRLHALPVEYPPGAEAPFALTLLPIGDPVAAFIVGMGVVFVAGYLLCLRLGARGSASRYALYLLLGAQGTLLDRYDLCAALLALGALWCVQRRRFVLAYVLLAGGIALKFYPAVLIPAVAIVHWQETGTSGTRRAMRVAVGVTLCGTLVGVSTLLPMLLAPGGLSALGYASQRPVQVESTLGTLVWLGTLAGIPATVENSFASQSFAGPLAGALPGPGALLLLAGCLWICWLQARRHLSVERAFLAALCVLLVTSKVLSAQYLVWVLPLAAEAGGLEPAWMVIAVLTTLDYPLLFPYSFGIPPLSDVKPYMAVVAARNATLLCVTLVLLLRRAQVGWNAKRAAESRAEASLEEWERRREQVRVGRQAVGYEGAQSQD
jgi:hypothetical protein